MISIQNILFSHLDNLSISFDGKHRLWKFLNNTYGDYHRTYHGWRHIIEGLSVFKDLRINDTELIIAWFFHDCIIEYDGNDEIKSAQECLTFLKEYTDRNCSNIISYILSTIHPQKNDAFYNQLISDIDLVGLASDALIFEYTTKLIWEEVSYIHELGIQEYTENRCNFFEKLLGNGPIYQTPQFTHLEHKAQVNIDNYLQSV